MVKQIKRVGKQEKRKTKSTQKTETNKAQSQQVPRTTERSVKVAADKGYAVFRVGKEKFCIDLDLIHEIINTFSIHSAPHLPKVFSGVITLRGESMPAVDLYRLLHKENRREGARTCLVVSIGSSRVGFLVDSDVEMVAAKHGSLHPLPDCYNEEESDVLDGIFWVGGEFIGILRPHDVVRIIAKCAEDDEKV